MPQAELLRLYSSRFPRESYIFHERVVGDVLVTEMFGPNWERLRDGSVPFPIARSKLKAP